MLIAGHVVGPSLVMVASDGCSWWKVIVLSRATVGVRGHSLALRGWGEGPSGTPSCWADGRTERDGLVLEEGGLATI